MGQLSTGKILGLLILIILAVGVGFYVSAKMSAKPAVDQSTSSASPTSVTSPAPEKSPTTLANPASVNCTKVGGKLEIKKRADGGEYGVCSFEGGECEEWALFRGECPVGGVKTIGFDNQEQIYCAILGGQTLAVKDAQCKFSDGSTCADTALFNGTCTKGQNK